MKKWIIFCSVFVLILGLVVWKVFYTQEQDDAQNAAKNDLEMNGTFIYEDASTKNVDFTIQGDIRRTRDGSVELDIAIMLPEDFRYRIDTTESHLLSTNQKNNDLPHLVISQSYAYDKQKNVATVFVLALDLENEYAIVLFQNAPDCYLVAARDDEATYDQLLAHFTDFTTSDFAKIWNQ
ncbi:MAG: hypothetical protein E7468_04235 [Ruminococcaceae bacterium]|nr:hypothetical protein [Oscillospiraceae bacterium]